MALCDPYPQMEQLRSPDFRRESMTVSEAEVTDAIIYGLDPMRG